MVSFYNIFQLLFTRSPLGSKRLSPLHVIYSKSLCLHDDQDFDVYHVVANRYSNPTTKSYEKVTTTVPPKLEIEVRKICQ